MFANIVTSISKTISDLRHDVETVQHSSPVDIQHTQVVIFLVQSSVLVTLTSSQWRSTFTMTSVTNTFYRVFKVQNVRARAYVKYIQVLSI
jgi:hypothetical protein